MTSHHPGASRTPLYPVFNQDFFPHESLQALRLAHQQSFTSRPEFIARVMELLPQPAASTRRHIAAKIAQRYLTGTTRRLVPESRSQPLVRLVARTTAAPTRIELLYYQTARSDPLVGALAREIFYPAGVLHQPPPGITAPEFAVRNGGQLLGDHLLVLRRFVVDYARERWGFTQAGSLNLALRILQQAGLVGEERLPSLRHHPSAFVVRDHQVALRTFAWALYSEVSPGTLVLSMEALQCLDLVRVLMLSGEQVRELANQCRRQGLLAVRGTQVQLLLPDFDALVDALLR